MPTTYEPIATTTLGSAQADITFSSISSSFTDLVIVSLAGVTTSATDYYLRFNGDTGSNYSRTYIEGTGNNANSGNNSSQTFINLSSPSGNYLTTSIKTATIIQIQNYSNSTTNKTILVRGGSGDGGLLASVGLWRSTSAITSIRLYPSANNFASGSTFTLYGIKAA